MTLDELIAKLQEIREKRGGEMPVVVMNHEWGEHDDVYAARVTQKRESSFEPKVDCVEID